jgi:hypothetical protein
MISSPQGPSPRSHRCEVLKSNSVRKIGGIVCTPAVFKRHELEPFKRRPVRNEKSRNALPLASLT